MNDNEILKLFDSNPEKALELIYNKYIDFLYREAFFMLRNKKETEDVLQDLFLDLWKKQNLLRNINISLKYYLRKAIINRTINVIIKQKYFENVEIEEVSKKMGTLTDQLEVEELNLNIKKAIDLLPKKCRTIFILSRFENMTYKEISKELSISVKTVENQISKALKILRKNIII